MFDRLRYVRHMYTCMFEAHQWGGSCIDPLFYYYPDDEGAYEDMEHTFIVGGALKVSPVLAADVTSFDAYFPAGQWVDTHTFATFSMDEAGYTTLGGQTYISAFLRPGTMVAL
mmetsp:Transcript_21812/g.16165  ORF Transcript_21812/g.16165 Transcript_21812/m.16165 type:complete len:113 (+) Transcript_21812:2049-2387(+)